MRSIVPGSRGSALLCHDAHEWPYLRKNYVFVTHAHRPNSVNVTLSAHVRLELATWIGETVGLLSQMWSKGAGACGKTKGGMHKTEQTYISVALQSNTFLLATCRLSSMRRSIILMLLWHPKLNRFPNPALPGALGQWVFKMLLLRYLS